ncbi:MAG: leucine-rich repeat domain-containing protein [Anaerolineae bacterium]|nr:leucine-rich repeat domain-containing protein [Anaerolineae bacterium]
MYRATGGTYWSYQDNWLSNQPICHWDGVTWSDGHIVGLELTNNNLQGKVPPEIGLLTNLQLLCLDHNQLSALPPEIGQLVKLRDLVLSHNQLSDLPPEIGRLTQLRTLFLHNNHLQELPPEMGQMINLSALDLSGNPLSELPAELAQLTNLKHLWLNGNRLSESLTASGRSPIGHAVACESVRSPDDCRDTNSYLLARR